MVLHGQTKERYSRLWIPDDICDVMSKKSSEKLNLGSQALNSMENLHLLKIRNPYFNKGPSYLPNELQRLNWHKFPSTSLAEAFEGEKVRFAIYTLFVLKIFQVLFYLENLKYLNLSYSDGLAMTPDFSMMSNLEKLNLSNCKNLLGVHESLGILTKLRYLNLSHCPKLKSLLNTIHLESLEKFLLWVCSKLGNFPQSLESITYSICGLRYLRTLNLSGCSKLETLPETLGQLETLEEVLVDGTAITKLPPTVSKMGNLKILSFSGCKNVKKKKSSFGVSSLNKFTSLSNVKNLVKRSDGEKKKPQAARPSLSGLLSLKKLDLNDSDLVGEIAADIWQTSALRYTVGIISLQHAFLRKISFFNFLKTGICAADLLLEMLLQGRSILYGQFNILIAGGKIPEWFDHQKISFIPNSRLGVTFKLISPDHREYTFESVPAAASKMAEVYETGQLWITFISFNLFRLLFPNFTAEDWTTVCGCLAIRIRQDWRCGMKVVYKQDLTTLASERAGINQHSESKELVVYEGGNIASNEEGRIKEDIAALMAGVTELNWDVDPIEQDKTQLMNLRKSAAYKIQNTLSFEC
ncbi:unnamed protein product [Withania somnifera]